MALKISKPDNKGRVKVTTPKGKFLFPKLTKPDQKFNKFSVKLVLPTDDNDTQQLIEFLDQRNEEAFNKWRAKNKKQAAKQRVNVPYAPEVDDNGDETGNTLFTFQYNASGTRDDGTTWKASPPAMFDAKGKPVKKGIDPWTGTIGKVSFLNGSTDSAFANPAGVGVSNRLLGVQIIELQQGGGARSADDLGFEEEEDGFDADEVSEDDSSASGDDEDAPDEDEDDDIPF